MQKTIFKNHPVHPVKKRALFLFFFEIPKQRIDEEKPWFSPVFRIVIGNT